MRTRLARAMVKIGLATGILLGAVTASADTITFDAGTPSDILNGGSLESTDSTVDIHEVAMYVTGGTGLTGIGTCWPSGSACDPGGMAVPTSSAASNIDHYWLQGSGGSPSSSNILFKFITPTSDVVAVAGLDEGPLPFDALQFIVWGSDEFGTLIKEGAIKAIFDDGVDPSTEEPFLGGPGATGANAISITVGQSDDFSSVWTFGESYTYFVVTPGDHIKGFSSQGEFEIDGLASATISAEDCEEVGGCDIGGARIEFPPESAASGATVSTSTLRVNGDGGRCLESEPRKLELLGGAVVLPPYLCGSPDFIMISTTLEGVDIFNGTVFVVNDTKTVLPDNFYTCTLDIGPDPPPGDDPQHQDVVGWQSSDKADMLETDLGAGAGALFTGSVGEFTDGCGTTRGRVRGASHYFIGLSIVAGPDFADNTAGNFDGLVALTRYKILLLQQSVEVANEDDALVKNGNYKKMRKFVRSAIRNLDAGNHVKARSQIDNFLNFIQSFNYNNISTKNHFGEHLMRASNIEFMLRVKVIPYAL